MTHTTLKKWGNSLGFRIPKTVLAENKLQEGTLFIVHSKDGKIILEPQRTIKSYPFRVKCKVSGKMGSIALDQIRCIDKSRLAKKWISYLLLRFQKKSEYWIKRRNHRDP